MIKIVRNRNQCRAKALRNCRYLLYTDDFGVRQYAKVSLRPVYGYILARIKGFTKLT